MEATSIRRKIWSVLAANSDRKIVRKTRTLAERIVQFLHAENHDFRSNGESRVLDSLGSSATVILDVGANRGAWSLEASRRCRRAQIHCFEISSITRQQLKDNVASAPQIKVADFGLAESSGWRQVKYYPDRDAVTSIYDYPHPGPYTWIEECVQTGDGFVSESGLTHIDLLKIDAEGSDFHILKGFEQTLSRRIASVVQFEYGFACILSRSLLIDFYELLEDKDYVVGKLHKSGVEFRAYRLEDENFFGPNFIAVQCENKRLIAKLSEKYDKVL
jgi:FkbM family methyltransferase